MKRYNFKKIEGGTVSIRSDLTEEQSEIFVEFAKKFVESQEDCPPEILRIMDENFWDLI